MILLKMGSQLFSYFVTHILKMFKYLFLITVSYLTTIAVYLSIFWKVLFILTFLPYFHPPSFLPNSFPFSLSFSLSVFTRPLFFFHHVVETKAYTGAQIDLVLEHTYQKNYTKLVRSKRTDISYSPSPSYNPQTLK